MQAQAFSAGSGTPERQVRAVFDDDTITVYQAYSADIAVPAVARGTFRASPFKLGRMTWIKPSFLWMMYRSGWATKPGQEHVLAIQISRTGFEEALESATLSHFDPAVYPDRAAWESRRDATSVRVQWDPERDLALRPLAWRSLQVGLAAQAAQQYVDAWITSITDVTQMVRATRALVESGQNVTAIETLPQERRYPLPEDVARAIGADPT